MSVSSSLSTASGLEYKSYCEDENFMAEGKPEPNSRSQTVVNHLRDKAWWIKVTFHGIFPPVAHHTKPGQLRSKRERRIEFQDFVKLIDFESLARLDDTVTEVILKEDTKAIKDINLLRDPTDKNRCQFPSFQAIKVTELSEEHEITDGVFRVLHKGDNKRYVLKVVNRPLYHPRDSDVLRQELENLELFKGIEGIIQPAGVAVIPNPYATDLQNRNPQTVISGILLEYCGGGNLQRVLGEQRVNKFRWGQWDVQIGNALDTLHRAKKTHMDLKPSNVVLDDDGNAVLVDISGIGGMTHEWRAPEIMDEIYPFELPFQTRRLNDTWAYGTLLKKIAFKAEDSPFVKTLKLVANHLTQDVHTRLTLSEAISVLKASSQSNLFHDGEREIPPEAHISHQNIDAAGRQIQS
ncbi:hypothetical protein N7462_011337 [Penicillium macrosclerotiorum]|uniref:uncharacterized protein n=1 Tax=Penicillium macrosclerotiorum TaxID=303699 RepID=UPI0025485D04|nr:uncharacterized protein N7462_011337 [Penicillium macrosclerotiorum]KAJ5666928.1 hypothetical protein N7462_011337 [Penicillium macrosclerotiorum]